MYERFWVKGNRLKSFGNLCQIIPTYHIVWKSSEVNKYIYLFDVPCIARALRIVKKINSVKYLVDSYPNLYSIAILFDAQLPKFG